MKRCGLLFLLSFAPTLFAAQGRLETLDGKKYQGQIRVAPIGLVIANAVEEYVREIALTNVWQIRFDLPRSSLPLFTPSSAANPTKALPAPWQSGEVARGGVAGNVDYQSGVFTMKRFGANSQSESDTQEFVYQAVDGDCDLVARVISVQKKDSPAIAGLMIRETLKPDSRQVMVGVTGNRGGRFQWQEADGDSAAEKLDPAMTLWYWLRLKRLENTFSGYKSRNGRDWGLIQTVNIPMKEKSYFGLVLNTRAEVRPISAMFDHVRSGEFLVDETLVPKVEMRGGSVIAGRVESADESAIRFADPAALASVPTVNAARIVYRWLTPKMEDSVRGGRVGVLLTNGDFVEGAFRGIQKGQVKVSSVLFGLRTFDVFDEVAAVILDRPSVAPHLYEIETWNQTLLRVDSIQPGMGEFVIRDKVLGTVRLPAEAVSDLTRRK